MAAERGAVHFALTHSAAGGLLEIWNDIGEGLAARGYAVARFALYPPAEDVAFRSADGPAWHHVTRARPRGLRGLATLLAALVRYLRDHRPAIVVTAMPAANVLVPLAAALAGTRTRVVITHHSPADNHNPHINRLDGWTGRLDCVRAVVSVSDAVGASLDDKPAAYRRKRRTIHNALPGRIEEAIAALVAHRAPAATAERRIVALGRLTYQKNYPLLISAMADVPDAVLDIVGGGEDEAALRELAAALGVADKIRFHGHTPRTTALELAAGARAFVQVSHYEGHSLALIEAARLGLPIVVSDVDVQIEGVTARDGLLCGLIVPRDEPRVLGQVLCDLLDDPRTHALWTQRARQLGAEASNAAMIDAYEAVVEESRYRG